MIPKRPRTMFRDIEILFRKHGDLGDNSRMELFAELDAERAVSDELAAALETFADMWDSRHAKSHSNAAIAKRVAMWKQANAALARWSGEKESE